MVDTTQYVKESGDIFELARQYNYTVAEAMGLVATYDSIVGSENSPKREKYLQAIGCIDIAKLIAVDDLRAIGLPVETVDEEELKECLWGLGVDTQSHQFTFDVGCFNTNGKVRCGLYLIGQERTDDEWCNHWENGRRVASLEAQIRNSKDPSLATELRRLQSG